MRVLLTGASGFLGQRAARELAARGHRVRCLLHQAALPRALAGLPLEATPGDVARPETLGPALEGVEAVVHLVAVIRERGDASFEAVNHQGTAHLIAAARAAGVSRLLYMSNLGAGPNPAYPFLRSKWQGEEAVRASGIPWTVFRSSILFGAGSELIGALAGLARYPLVMPIIGSGKARFQPLWVEDAARCLALALEDPAAAGETICLGGPQHLTYEQLVDAALSALGQRRWKLHVPLALMRPAVWLMERVLPHPPLTGHQLKMLSVDNTTDIDAVKRRFGFAPKPLGESLGFLAPPRT